MHADYEHGSISANRFVRFMTLVNVGLSLAVIGLWSFLAPYIAEPLSAAMKTQLPTGDRIDLLNPSFAMLWLPPILAILLANLSLTGSYYRLSRWIAAFPLVMLIMSLIWYYAFSANYN
jgi:uncharacterized membrane protein (DUF485 family)